jgi:hypothetical protein
MSQPTDDLTRSELRAIGGVYRGGSGARRGSRRPRSSKPHVLACGAMGLAAPTEVADEEGTQHGDPQH